jgi:tRNA/rRNA methyltransferase
MGHRLPGSPFARQTRFVLVSSKSGGNVGAAARAMKNLGFSRLVLVSPACDPLGDEARRMAVDAADLLESAITVPELDAALAGASVVAGTTGLHGKHRRPHFRLQDAARTLTAGAAASERALVFGREDRGLTDEELDRCTHLVYLPSDAAYPSYNLAQAVLLVAWELRRAERGGRPFAEVPIPAGHEEREALYAHLRHALTAIGFLNRDGAEVVMRRLRRLIGRSGASSEELTLLRGMARQMLWAAGRAGLLDDDGGAEERFP